MQRLEVSGVRRQTAKGCRRLRLPEFLDIRHIKVVSLSAPGTGRLYPVIFVISVRGWVSPRPIVRP